MGDSSAPTSEYITWLMLFDWIDFETMVSLKKSPTEESLDSIENTVEQAVMDFQFFGSHEDACAAGSRLTSRTQSESVPGISKELALKVAKQIGRRIALARHVVNEVEEVTPLHDLAVLMTHVVVPDRDEARRRAAHLARTVSVKLLELNHKNGAAIAVMTSARSLLELSNPTREDLLSAYEQLKYSYSWRVKGTVDSGYHNFNLSLARRRLIELGELERSDDNFAKTIKGFDRAKRLFEKYQEPIDVALYHENVLETLTPWLHEKVSQVEDRYVRECSESDLRQVSGRFAHDLLERFKAIRSNPASFGYESVPDWVPSEHAVLSETIETIPRFRERLLEAEEHVENHPEAHRLAAKIYELQRHLTPLLGQPEIPYDALASWWHRKDYENYLYEALKALGYVSTELSDSSEYIQVIQRVYLSFRSLREMWETGRLQKLLEQFSVKFRFCACELAAFGLWKEAFLLLEDSRGLIASGTASLMHSVPTTRHVPNKHLWIHVTHSPRGTYLICNKQQDYFGVEFQDIHGSLLASHFSGYSPPGLINPQAKHDRRLRAAAIDRISILLAPIGEWILNQGAESVVIHSGGFYQAYPIWALSKLFDAIVKFDIKIFQVPSQTLALDKKKTHPPENVTFSVQEAAHVAGAVPLECAEREVQWLLNSAPAGWKVDEHAATPSTVVESGIRADFFHFSGHSSASINPKQSFLVTYAGPLTVETLLSERSTAKLVFLSSCESGLPQNFELQDEQLSIQSAFWYVGAAYSLGTYWSVADGTAGIFSRYFYETLFQQVTSGNRDFDELVYVSWVSAVRQLREKYSDSLLDWASFGLVGLPNTQTNSTTDGQGIHSRLMSALRRTIGRR